MSKIECASCGEMFDVSEETHYRIGEQERPVPDAEDMDTDDWFSRGWYVCLSCALRKFDFVDDPRPDDD